MKNLMISCIKFYKKYLSLWNYGISVCKFEPSCSTYTLEAIEKFGAFKGAILGFYRIIRCNPFNKGGFDPVPEK